MKDSEMEPRTGSPMLIDRFSNLLPYAHFSEEDNLCAIAAPNFNSFEGLGYVIEIVPQTGCTPVMAKSLKHLFSVKEFRKEPAFSSACLLLRTLSL